MTGFENIKTQPSAAVRISQALVELKRRGVTSDYCPRCNTFDWSVDINDIPANSAMAKPSLPPLPLPGRITYRTQPTAFISVLSIVCKTCGYTMFHNMEVLGV